MSSNNMPESETARGFLSTSNGWIAALSLVTVAVIARLLPHPPNFTPMAAIALFGGAVLVGQRGMMFVILAAMLISDAIIGWHPVAPVIYGALIANVVIGRRFLRPMMTSGSMGLTGVARIAGASLLGSVLFFLVSNLGHFFLYYPTSWSSLIACYTAAIPFFQFTVAGDLVYSTAFFSAYAFATQGLPALRGSTRRTAAWTQRA